MQFVHKDTVMTVFRSPATKVSLGLAVSLALSACSAVDRLENIGEAPAFSPIAVAEPHVALPMPAQKANFRQANSLWQSGSRAFFRDPRASKVGDILTVNIAIGDQASIANTTSRSRKSSEDANATNFLGIESEFSNILPDAIDPSSLIKMGSGSNNTGTGTVNRSEDIKLTVAALVTRVLPNGNLVIQGQQEVRVNYEVRELMIAGVVRPEDISNGNTINHTQIAEARISYGGRGQLSDVQQARYGQQLYDILFPF